VLKVKKFLYQNNVNVVQWPAQSPDLSPIENVWGYIKGELYKDNINLKTKDQTWERIKSIWYNEVPNLLPKLYSSMDTRMNMVMSADGKRINY